VRGEKRFSVLQSRYGSSGKNSETEDEKAAKAKVVTVSSRAFYPQAAIQNSDF
jgi:hypothetical protein